jgi:hypothetical protein
MQVNSPRELCATVAGVGGAPVAALRPPLAGEGTVARLAELLVTAPPPPPPPPASPPRGGGGGGGGSSAHSSRGSAVSLASLVGGCSPSAGCGAEEGAAGAEPPAQLPARFGGLLRTPLSSAVNLAGASGAGARAAAAEPAMDISACLSGFNLRSLGMAGSGGGGGGGGAPPTPPEAAPPLTVPAMSPVSPFPLASLSLSPSPSRLSPMRLTAAGGASPPTRPPPAPPGSAAAPAPPLPPPPPPSRPPPLPPLEPSAPAFAAAAAALTGAAMAAAAAAAAAVAAAGAPGEEAVAAAPVTPSRLGALLFDCSHDNETPAQRRSAEDVRACFRARAPSPPPPPPFQRARTRRKAPLTPPSRRPSSREQALPSSALIAFAAGATGSTRGFDILAPENISVVTDLRLLGEPPAARARLARAWLRGAPPPTAPPAVAPCVPDGAGGAARYLVDVAGTGIRAPRRRLNALRQEMAARGHVELLAGAGAVGGAEAAGGLRWGAHDAGGGWGWGGEGAAADAVLALLRAHPSEATGYVVITRPAFKGCGFSGGGGGLAGVCVRARLPRPRPPHLQRATRSRTRPPSHAPPRPAPCKQTHPPNRRPLPPVELEGAVVAGVVLAASLHVPSARVRRRPPPLAPAAPPQPSLLCDEHPARHGGGGGGAAAPPAPPAAPAAAAQPPAAEEGGGGWDADPTHVNGLRCELSYWDDTLPPPPPQAAGGGGEGGGGGGGGAPAALRAAALLMADFSDTARGARVELDPRRFLPGSVLVLRVALPRLPPPPARGGGGGGDAPPFPPPRARGGSGGSAAAAAGGGGGGGGFFLAAPPPAPASPPRAAPRLLPAGPPLSALYAALSPPALTLVHLNALLYRCDPEERDASCGARGVYVVPGAGPLPWAGLAGVASALRVARTWNDSQSPCVDFAPLAPAPFSARALLTPPFPTHHTAHARAARRLLANLREGPWLMEYFIARGREEAAKPGCAALAAVVDWLAAHYARAAAAPPLLRPQAFARATVAALRAAAAAALARMPGPLLEGAAAAAGGARDGAGAPAALPAALALTSVALFGAVPSAPALSPRLPPPAAHLAPSLAAGFPHFAAGYMRCWGRDTFISLRGLLLATGRWGDARGALLAGGTLLRHGLLPNLLDGGARPRYNCRDAVWWWARAVADYCGAAPEGAALLLAPVARRWPSDAAADYEAPPGGGPLRFRGPPPPPAPLGALLAEALARHAEGIDFTEWGAEEDPRGLDAHMTAEGFRVRAWVDPATGFVHGGNGANCGTWMDKMGCVAGVNAGVPATPRDGAAVEVTGLLFSVLRFMAALPEGALPARGAALRGGEFLTWAAWAARVKAHFERAYFVPPTPAEDAGFAVHAAWVHRRGVFKDTVGSAAGWSDYQLRPNALVAMAVAPELFTRARAQGALAAIERQLIGEAQLGVKTLDPGDWAFRGDYAAGAGGDKRVAGGWNYHQGPEWVWPYGVYLRARLRFPPPPLAAAGGGGGGGGEGASGWRCAAERRRWLLAALAAHRAHVEAAPEGGLPELTNAGGRHCADSCSLQAWSGATVLDALEDLRLMEAAERATN